MRRPLRNLVAFIALGTGLSACSLLVDFDEEGQPCDELYQCLDGFSCVDNACVPDDSAPSDGGADGGADGGLGSDSGTGDAGSDAGTSTDSDGGTTPDSGPNPTDPAPTDPVPNNPTS